MTYQQTLEYLYSRLPMFTKIGASAIKKDLTNTIALCEVLANPYQKFKSIHVGGTNGKGSTSHMLAAILQTAGYKTGLYTSPHLKDFRERIKINGEMISEKEVVNFVDTIKDSIETISPSFFEVTVAMAFDYFAKEQVDIAIIEVGLGGRLDSTNIISPELSIITNIGLDHVNILGNTLEKIAFEKAGIIKKNTPVIIGEYLPVTLPIFAEKANHENSPLYLAQDLFQTEFIASQATTNTIRVQKSNGLSDELDLDLTGLYQLKNIKTVFTAVNQLREKGFNITTDHLKQALKNVKGITGLMGRWQVLQQNPLVICDTGHNEDGIKEVLKNIAITPHQQLHFVLGMVKDKDIAKVLSLLPQNAVYYFCAPAFERAKPANELAQEASGFGLKGHAYTSISAALEAAKNNATTNDLIFVGGSTFVVAEVV
ncbi:bifunctional folylpolyglutamate synthase/dihydrofolate synthase [Pseudopedobacter beijingensis]|uniref:Dihydrofolate synthase/folylpolyglutamate synthase n=1 Tax=Pseudopedobacter beijingensis TaxID=1207056 RepID=A0ABW4IFP8_9SPHI